MTDLITEKDTPLPAEAGDEAIWNEMEAAETPAAEPSDKDRDDSQNDLGSDPDPKDPPAATPAPVVEDPWAAAPEPLRADYEKIKSERDSLAQRIRSDDGRVAAYQRKMEALKTATAKQPGEEKDIRTALSGIVDEYPEIAKPLTEALGLLDTKIGKLAEAEESRTAAAQQDVANHIEVETKSLLEKHPDYEAFLEKNGAAFGEWIEDQPRRIRDAAYRNAKHIADAAGAIEIMDGFKKHLGIAVTPAPDPNPDPNPPLNDRRQRQLDATASPAKPGSSRPTVSGIPEDGDPQAIWDAMEAADARKAKA